MRIDSHASAFKRLTLVLWAACLLVAPCRAQNARPIPSEQNPARVSIADGLSLSDKIKEVESPAFRAYLYSNVAAWLWQSAGEEQSLRRAAADAAARGVSDISEHEREIPPAPASWFYEKLLGIVRRHSPEEAARIERAHPLRAMLNRSEQDRAGGSLHAALRKLDDPQTAAQGLEEALRLISSGGVPMNHLQGELLHQGNRNSPALPQLLSATLALEERNAGSVPFLNLFFLSFVYLRDSTPAELRARFLAASVTATRHMSAAQRSDPHAFNWALNLLRTVLPHLRKSNHALHAEAAARLANFAPGATREDDVFERVRDSADPLAAALVEADATNDAPRKKALLESAARHARRQGKLRLAVELISSAEDRRVESSEVYSSRDEFLDEVLQQALAQKEMETARYAASKIGLPSNRAAALRRLARHSFEQRDAQSTAEHLNEALKALRESPDGTARAVAYLRLASDFTELDAPRAAEVLREALKATNNIPRPRVDPGGESSWKLFPVADAVTAAFRRLAKADRAAASGLTNDLQPKELIIAAALGVYGDPPK